ncbi:glycoside hydrolase family 3 protein [Dyella flava]|uniref:Glycoside hydrolase family 3 protein n=2 Tax=Dyella flava TaxID=1920170 RepID=A0ABS2JZW2_9GAMM|nr:glycoside hydrolase family 3 protein [Dyella flava]
MVQGVCLAEGHAWDDKALSPDQRAAKLVDAMTLDEQIALLRPVDGASLASLGIQLPPSIPAWMRQPKPAGAIGSAGYVPAIPRLDFPALQESDAGLGVADIGYLRPGDAATALPSSLALAASFDTGLAREAGSVIGAEAHAKGFNVQLAGGADLIRDPRNGRNFEYASEDPLLTGDMVGEEIAGIQSKHIVSTIKHYVLNDQETGRTVLDARIDEAALRESDLLAFQVAIERGHPGAVMCSYNKVNGNYACESDFLLNRVLKGEWEFPGWVMSDWGAVHSLKQSVDAGLDQESPQGGDPDYFAGLKDAVTHGDIPREKVRDMAYRIVRALFAVGAMDDRPAPGGTIDKVADAAAAQRVAEAGAVLLKNDGQLLPLHESVKSIAIIGGHADIGVLSGGGSSQVTPYGGSFRDARGQTGIAAFLSPVYDLSSPLKALQALRPGTRIVFDDGSDPQRAAELARHVDVALVFAVKPQIESLDAPDLSLPYQQDALIDAVATVNHHTAVVLETGNPVAMPWLPKVKAVLEAWYPGQRGGEAIASLLDGKAAPAGRLPVTFPAGTAQLPRPAIPGFDPARQVPFEGAGRLSPFPVDYPEGSNVGYRWFEKNKFTPLFPFGYGLTYTHFAYSHLLVKGGQDLQVSFKLANTGRTAGVEVAQLYVAVPGRTHRLVGWAKVDLKPGESQTVTITADPRFLASYDATLHRWTRLAGVYDVYVGKAAGVSTLHGSATLAAQ